MQNITAVIVSYNRADLLKRAYDSLRNPFPEMPIIIIDGSSVDNPCYDYVRTLSCDRTEVVSGYNAGHGRGMDRGIKLATTKFVLLMDSDAEVLEPAVLDGMLAQLLGNEQAFGVGQVVHVNVDGTNVGEDYPDPIPYLHPHFAMINAELYMKVPGFVHHGAPCLRTMQYINTFKKFDLVDFPVGKFVNHEGRGTRVLNPEGFLKGWE